MDLLIGLDIGTTKICAVALDAAGGTLPALESAPNDAALPSDPDAAEQDAKAILDKSFGLLARMADRIETECPKARLVGLGVTGQMHGVVMVDGKANPLTPLVTWQDARGNRPCAKTGLSYAGELARRLGADALTASGCAPSTGYGAVTLMRMAEEAALPPKAVALTIHDLMVRLLCGVAGADPTDAASWGIFDVRDGTRWLPEIEQALRIPKGLLPGILPTGTAAGTLLPEAASATRLPAGLPVAVALGDNQASFLGSVPSLSDTILVNLGTGGQVSAPVSAFARADGLETRPLVRDTWLLVGASLCGGRSYQVLEEFFARVGRDLFGIERGDRLYDLMNRLAAQADQDCGGLVASTLFDGSRENPSQRGSLLGINVANLTPANLTRAVIAGMVEELAGFYQAARRAGAAPSLLAGSGNAIRLNPAVREEVERRFGMPLSLPPHREEAAVGAALAAGVAAGVYADWQAAQRTLSQIASA